MKKGIKISLWILGGLASIVIALICLVGLFSYFTQNYKNGQDNYFARVEYYIEGNVINRQEVGGPYCLIELAPTRFEITRNDIRSSDDYVGVYATDTSKVFTNINCHITITILHSKFLTCKNDIIHNILKYSV